MTTNTTPSAPTAEMLVRDMELIRDMPSSADTLGTIIAMREIARAALARSEPPTGEPVAISDDDIAHLRNLVNDTRIAAVESSAVYRALCALLAEARAPVAVPAGEPKERT